MWIPSDSSLRDHPKLTRLTARLKISRVEAIGHLHALWWWVGLYAPDGSLESFDASEICTGALWEGDADGFIDAMIYARFLDADPLSLHNWHKWGGAYHEKKRDDRERKKREREAKKQSESVRGQSSGRPADVTRKSGVEVREVQEVGKEKKDSPPDVPGFGTGPTEREVVVAGLLVDIPPGFAKHYWQKCNAANRWLLRDGRRMVWAAELEAWWGKDQERWREPSGASRPSASIERELIATPEENSTLRTVLRKELDFARAAEKRGNA